MKPIKCNCRYYPHKSWCASLPKPRRLVSDRVAEFLDWLNENTDYPNWSDFDRIQLSKKLVDCMISDKVYCNVDSIHDGEDRQGINTGVLHTEAEQGRTDDR
jgi:hypothetical protein